MLFLGTLLWQQNYLVDWNHMKKSENVMRLNLSSGEPPKMANTDLRIHLVVFVDAHFKRKYRLQLETIQCYAEANNYVMVTQSGDEMDHKDCSKERIPTYFLRRHCHLASLMETFAEDDYFVLLDADTMAFDLTRKFPEEYLEFDLAFYERSWNGEVHIHMGIKNKPAVREWIKLWSLEDQQPYVPSKQYYYSSDNGLLHVLLMKWFVLGIRTVYSMSDITSKMWSKRNQRVAVMCIEMFSNLKIEHKHLLSFKDLEQYWSFIQCARVALTMQGRGDKFAPWTDGPRNDYILTDFRKNGVEMKSQGISLKIFPRFHGFALDNFMKKNASEHVVFLHAAKKKDDVLEVWQTSDNLTMHSHNLDSQLSIYPHCRIKT